MYIMQNLRVKWASIQSHEIISCGLTISLWGQQRLWSEWEDAQADLSLLYADIQSDKQTIAWTDQLIGFVRLYLSTIY